MKSFDNLPDSRIEEVIVLDEVSTPVEAVRDLVAKKGFIEGRDFLIYPYHSLQEVKEIILKREGEVNIPAIKEERWKKVVFSPLSDRAYRLIEGIVELKEIL